MWSLLLLLLGSGILSQCSGLVKTNWDIMFIMRDRLPISNDVLLPLRPDTNFSSFFMAAKTIFPERRLPKEFVGLFKLRLVPRPNFPITLFSVRDAVALHQNRFSVELHASAGQMDIFKMVVTHHPPGRDQKLYSFTLPFPRIDLWTIMFEIREKKILLYTSCEHTQQPMGFQMFKLPLARHLLFEKEAIMWLFHNPDGTGKLQGELVEFSFSNYRSKLYYLCNNVLLDGSGQRKMSMGSEVEGNIIRRIPTLESESTSSRDPTPALQRLLTAPSFSSSMVPMTTVAGAFVTKEAATEDGNGDLLTKRPEVSVKEMKERLPESKDSSNMSLTSVRIASNDSQYASDVVNEGLSEQKGVLIEEVKKPDSERHSSSSPAAMTTVSVTVDSDLSAPASTNTATLSQETPASSAPASTNTATLSQETPASSAPTSTDTATLPQETPAPSAATSIDVTNSSCPLTYSDLNVLRKKFVQEMESESCDILKKLRLKMPMHGAKGEQGPQGDPGRCKPDQCPVQKGEPGQRGTKGQTGPKGNTGDIGGGKINVEVVRSLAKTIISAEMTSSSFMDRVRGHKGEAGQCQCASDFSRSSKQANSKVDKNDKSKTRSYEMMNVGYGSIVFENQRELEEISYRLPLGSMVYVLKTDTFLVKVDLSTNIWRAIAMESSSRDWILPGATPAPPKPTPPIYVDNMYMKLHLIALPAPTMGDLKPQPSQPGGYSGSMFQCQQAASVAGVAGVGSGGSVMQPFLNTDSYNLRYAIQQQHRGVRIYNTRNEILTNDFVSLLSGKESLQNEILDFRRNPISDNKLSPCVWIGKELRNGDNPDDYSRNAEDKCLNWMSRRPIFHGIALTVPKVGGKPLFHPDNRMKRACSQLCYVLCIQTQPN